MELLQINPTDNLAQSKYKCLQTVKWSLSECYVCLQELRSNYKTVIRILAETLEFKNVHNKGFASFWH